MLLHELKIRFDAGDLVSATIVPELMGENWNLLLQGKKKKDQLLLTLQRKGEIRSFKTIDAAAKAAKSIGFLNVSIQFHPF